MLADVFPFKRSCSNNISTMPLCMCVCVAVGIKAAEKCGLLKCAGRDKLSLVC